MKHFFTFLLAAVSVVFVQKAYSQGTWVKQNLDARISVKFPKAPETQESGPAKIYTLTGSDSTRYTANFMDFESFGMDSATLTNMATTDEFAEQFKTGFTGKIPGFEVSKMDIGKWKDYTAYTIEGAVEEKKLKMYIKCIFIGSKMYSMSCSTFPTSDVKNKDAFLDSFELL